MELDNITFEEIDSPAIIATKTVLIHAGSPTLKTELKRLNIDYCKVTKGLNTYFYLSGEEIGKIRVKL